ncbi:DUF4249 domain-containing protein [Flavobacteriaceae bacterium]|nr:DUF4249 domain-containing protein [Flavobacteriaceae bacterium]
MKHLKQLILLISLGALSTACEEVIQLDLPTETPRLAIDASLLMTPNQTFTQVVKLSLSGNFYQEENPVVSNASVQLVDLTNNQILNFVYDATLENFKMDFTPSFNTDYKLRVVYENETYESSIEQLMHAVPIENLEQGGNTLFNGDEKEVIISYTDSAERDDFYLFDFGYQLYLATKDEFYQGNLFTFSYFYDDLLAGDQAVIKIMGINERHFNFMTILIDQTEDGGNPFNTTPSTVRGNISNLTNPDHYPMGYFRLSETYSASLVLE